MKSVPPFQAFHICLTKEFINNINRAFDAIVYQPLIVLIPHLYSSFRQLTNNCPKWSCGIDYDRVCILHGRHFLLHYNKEGGLFCG